MATNAKLITIVYELWIYGPRGLLGEAERALAMVWPPNTGAKLAKVIAACRLGKRRTTKSCIGVLVAGNVITQGAAIGLTPLAIAHHW